MLRPGLAQSRHSVAAATQPLSASALRFQTKSHLMDWFVPPKGWFVCLFEWSQKTFPRGEGLGEAILHRKRKKKCHPLRPGCETLASCPSTQENPGGAQMLLNKLPGAWREADA